MMKKRRRSIVSDQDLREYYGGTSSLDEGRKIRPVQMTFPKPRRLVALRLDEAVLQEVQRIAAEKGLNFSTLMRMWITERLNKERI